MLGIAKIHKETLTLSSDDLQIIFELSDDQLSTPLVVIANIANKLYCDVEIASLSLGKSTIDRKLYKADRHQKVDFVCGDGKVITSKFCCIESLVKSIQFDPGHELTGEQRDIVHLYMDLALNWRSDDFESRKIIRRNDLSLLHFRLRDALVPWQTALLTVEFLI